jgi:TRAP-type C4-dicarboxylate transport system permease small subunit
MKIRRWLDKHFEESFMIALLAMMAGVMTVQVVLRYLFRSPLSWAEEFCRYCQVWSTFISIGYCTKHGIMLKVDLFVKILTPPLKWVINLLVMITVAYVYVFFLLNSFEAVRYAFTSKQVSTGMGIPMYSVYSVAVLGFSLGILRQLQDIAGHFSLRKRKSPAGEDR